MAKNKKVKKLSLKSTPHIQIKTPLLDYGKLKPVFSFFHMRYGKNYCLSKCDRDHKADLATLLLKLSQVTWDEIASSYRKAYGYEQIPKEQFYANAFPDIVTPDVKKILVFSYSHGGRMAGLQLENVFHIFLVGDKLYKH